MKLLIWFYHRIFHQMVIILRLIVIFCFHLFMCWIILTHIWVFLILFKYAFSISCHIFFFFYLLNTREDILSLMIHTSHIYCPLFFCNGFSWSFSWSIHISLFRLDWMDLSMMIVCLSLSDLILYSYLSSLEKITNLYLQWLKLKIEVVQFDISWIIEYQSFDWPFVQFIQVFRYLSNIILDIVDHFASSTIIII